MDSDRSLVQRMTAGDERALGELYDRHGRVAYALAYAIVGERADADEVVVDAFGQAWRTAAHFDLARGSVAAWLTTIARTRALDLVRARGRRSRALERAALLSGEGVASPVASGDAPDRDAERSEARRLVTGALAALPEPQRRAIQLAYFGGLSQSEIAGELGEPLGTVKTRIRDGMAKLRELLRSTAGGGAT
jgi:RNA polymerase sigma-70 factor (ECF subfamily)